MTAQELERRSVKLPVELRQQGSRRVGGYGSVYNVRSKPLDGFVELVLSSCWNKTLGDGAGWVICRYQHDSNYLLGSVAGGTLSLSKDSVGLYYEVLVPETRSDVLELITRGDVSRSSVAFNVMDDQWDYADGYPLRSLVSARLLDVSPVSQPAYESTSVAALRSLARYVGAPEEDVLARRDSLRSFFVRTDRDGMSGVAARAEILKKRYPQQRLSGVAGRAEILKKRYPQQRLSGVAARAQLMHRRYGPHDYR
jgi:hypothetical protein